MPNHDIEITLHKENYWGAADSVIGDVVALHESHFWAEAPWRRKLKLARKLFQSLEQKLKLNWAARYKRSIDTRTTGDRERLKILNMLGAPLRLYFTNVFGGGFDDVLRIPISNKQGSYMTKLARKKKGWIHVGDLTACCHRGLPIAAVPFRNNWEGVPRIQYHEYWAGAVQYKEFMEGKKSVATIKEMETK